jgi:trk system potassium uptake protein TrkH
MFHLANDIKLKLMKSFHFSAMAHVLAWCLMIEAFFMLSGIGIALIYNEDTAPAFFYSFLTSFGIGAVVYILSHARMSKSYSVRDSFLIVSLSWFFISLFGTLPYLFTGSIPSFTDAFFETVSGFTTTGSSILNDIEALPHSVLFWRSLTHWIGGMGIIALVVAILPSLRISGNHLFSAEGAFFNVEKIQPRLIQVAKRLWLIYISLTAAEVVLLMWAHMNWFDAVCHAFATIATGGFSTQNTSVINYSASIQYILVIFMFLSGMNFVLHYRFVHGRWKTYFRDEEFRMYFFIIAGVTLLLSLKNMAVYHDTELSFRQSLFQVVSIITATGFSSADYEIWSQFSICLIFLLMFVGASVGSTGGGIKVARYMILLKVLKRQFRALLHPKLVWAIRFNNSPLSERNIQAIFSFVFMYFLSFCIGSLIMILTGLDVKSAISSVITTLGGIGPGLGKVGPVNNFSDISEIGKLYLSFNMILGRLEIIPILVFFSKNFYRS